MDDEKKKIILKRLAFVEKKAVEVLATKRGGGYEIFISSGPYNGFRSAGLSFISSLVGENNVYFREFNEKVDFATYESLLSGIEIMKSLRSEIENNWLTSIKGLVSAEIFSDFMEMAKHLLENKYKDASAVIIGSVLEGHLRQLAKKNGVEVATEKNGEFFPKKADRINQEMFSNKVYNNLDQKSITSWLDL